MAAFDETVAKYLMKKLGLTKAWYDTCKHRGYIPDKHFVHTDSVKIGNIDLLELCRAKNVSLKKVSEATGISYKTIKGYARGSTFPWPSYYRRLCEFFEVEHLEGPFEGKKKQQEIIRKHPDGRPIYINRRRRRK